MNLQMTFILFCTALLFGFHLYLRMAVLPSLSVIVAQKTSAVKVLEQEKEQSVSVGQRAELEQYAKGSEALQTLLLAREEVFSEIAEDSAVSPFIILDFLSFFEDFKALLGKKTVLSHLSISPSGTISFLLQTKSYRLAAQQMVALRSGFSKDLPPLLKDIDISSVGRAPLIGKGEDVPEVLRDSDAVTSFAVEAKINPEYYRQQLIEQKNLNETEL